MGFFGLNEGLSVVWKINVGMCVRSGVGFEVGKEGLGVGAFVCAVVGAFVSALVG